MKYVSIYGMVLPAWVALPLILFIWVTGLTLLKKLCFKTVKRLTKYTKTKLDDVFIESAELPATLLIWTSGGALVERVLPLVVEAELTSYLLIGFKATAILAVILFVDRFLNGMFKEYQDKVELIRSSGGVARSLVRVVVICLGVLILLDSFGISITPIIASLGIGSLAVALALQPTLENFFSGLQLIIDKPIQVGHFVKLESGEEGYVHRIGWRSTWVRMLPNNMIVIPNKSIVNSRITNFYYPEREMSVLVQVGVHYGSDLEKVEQVTIEVAKAACNEVTGGVEGFEAFIRYHTFDSSSINYSVILRVKEFVDQYLMKHEFIKRLHKRFREEGITIPYPIRAVNLDQERSFSNKPEVYESKQV